MNVVRKICARIIINRDELGECVEFKLKCVCEPNTFDETVCRENV